MYHANSKLTRPLLTILLMLACSLPATAQVDLLRQGDDQFIQGLREQGMAELLDRFADVTPPTDPVAALVLNVALKEFVATDRLNRARQANENRQFDEANALFIESRDRFNEMLAFQRQLIAEHADDERTPIWQTDLAQMLLLNYLPNYYQNVTWHYEFGTPSAEQTEVYESVMIEALTAADEANYRLDILPSRAGNNPALQAELEEAGIWYKLQDYRSLNTPYWLGHAAHGVTLLPDGHPYFAGGVIRNQRNDPAGERTRLRNMVVEAFSGELKNDRRYEDTAALISGQTLVWSDTAADVNEGIDFLETVIRDNGDNYLGYLATLSKAVGLWKTDQLEDARDILGGIETNRFVMSDADTLTRLLAADLMFRILTEEALKAPEAEQQALIGQAYTDAYVELIDGGDSRYGQTLFTRWAESVDEDTDPATLPEAVRMGIGQQLTQLGYQDGTLALQMLTGQRPALPDEAREYEAEMARLADSARDTLGRAVQFNETLIGDDMEAGPVLATALFNLAIDTYMIAELRRIGGDTTDWQPYLQAAQYWLDIAVRVEDSERAQQSLIIAIERVLPLETHFNKERVTQPQVRETYQRCFEMLLERWPQHAVVHNNRLYAGFHLFEKPGQLDEAIAVYLGLPNTHRDYYQAGRQMLFVMRRSYRTQADQRRLMLAQQPPDDAGQGATAAEINAHRQAVDVWELEFSRLDENIVRERDAISEAAQLLIADAEQASERGGDPLKQFSAASALGAARVVLAGIESDLGQTQRAIVLLDGFGEQFDPREGEFAELAGQQSNPEAARSTLQGLVQQAQEQRIIALLEANLTRDMALQAREMMETSPDVARFVVAGVIRRIETMIQTQERALREASFPQQEAAAREKITRYADAAVALSEILMEWAEQQDFEAARMVGFELPLIDALLLSGKPEDLTNAITRLDDLNTAFPNTNDILLRRGKAYLRQYRRTQLAADYNKANECFRPVINFFNQAPEKPADWWDAWLHSLLLEEATGDEARMNAIPRLGRVLIGIDPEMGGDQFKDRFLEVLARHGGVELLVDD